jgi:hypothetical protein
MTALLLLLALALGTGCAATRTTVQNPDCTPDITRREVLIGREGPPLMLPSPPGGTLEQQIERKSTMCL